MADQTQNKTGFSSGAADSGPLSGCMNIELVVNDNAEVWILHDRPFPAILQWAEYDEEMNSLGIVTSDGDMRDIGMVIPESVGALLRKAGELCAIYMKDGQIQDFGIIPVMVRETVFH